MKIETGITINQYKIISAIGKGGMGEVFLAQDTKLDRKVAIKFLNEEFSKDSDKLNRFIQEAKAVSALNHPNILTVYEIGENDEANFIVTEFIEGKTLREQLSPKKTNSLNSILKIGVQVAEALSAAHQARIIHRDIKPENIMIRQDGYAKVLDFGLAKLTEQKPKDDVLSEDTTKGLVKTNPGMVMGTVSYMSPEQARGKETDARTDIWSLGVVLYEMLAGKVPFTGETINHTIVSILEKEPKLLENIPDELQRIVRKTLTKDADMRYQSSKDLLIDLKNLRRTLDIQGELERSIVPNREITTNQVQENETAIYNSKSIEETKAESGALATQNVSNSSSLEYAVTKAKSNKLATAIIGIILLGAISAIAYFGFFANRSGKQINSIAVMPFENKNSDADTEYLSDGLAESVIFRLTQIPDLRVSPTSSVMRYKGKETDIAKIANELGVDAVMTGRLTKRGDNLNITVELVDARTNKSLWGEQYERKLSELLTTQREIVAEIVGKLQLKLSGESEQKLAKKYTVNPEAYQAYLKGRYYWNRRTADGMRRAIEQFDLAVQKDPNYALAYVGLADSYGIASTLLGMSVKESLPQAKAYANKALEIDNSLGEAHATLGLINSHLWNWAEAENAFKRSIELNPNYASAQHWYARLLNTLGRKDEALAEIKRANEIDPLSMVIISNVAGFYREMGDYKSAIEQCNKIIEIDPSYIVVYAGLAEIYLDQKRSAEALAEVEKARDIPSISIELSGRAYAQLGRRNEALAVIKQLEEGFAKGNNGAATGVARVYVVLGDKEKTFEWLEKAFQARDTDLPRSRLGATFDPVRDDPRFKDLLKRMNLPE